LTSDISGTFEEESVRIGIALSILESHLGNPWEVTTIIGLLIVLGLLILDLKDVVIVSLDSPRWAVTVLK
jgi:hypothetical protein